MSAEHELLTRYFDGEISRDALPAELRAEADRFERVLGVLDRASVRLPGSVKAAVMRRVRQERAPAGLRAAWRWALAPRAIRVSPLGGALAAAALLAAVLLTRGQEPGVAGTGPVTSVATRFVYLAPQATRVAVTGDFVNWDPAGVALERRGDGLWVAELRIEPGLHHYVFVIDGTEWRPDPQAASQVDDGFGRRNSVLLVAPRPEHAS